MEQQDIFFETGGGVGRITLNRPKVLNALSFAQVEAMLAKLREWAKEPSIRAVVIAATGEKAFCAGGDIRAMYEAGKAGNLQFLTDFYGTEYQLNRLIKTYPKPYVALMDGIVMGGGAGISIHGSHRVVTERTLFAMPETSIGFFPDVGGTYFLSRCPGAVGTYLALTSARLKAADLLHLGLATHFVPAARMEELAEALSVADDITQEQAFSAFSCMIEMYQEEAPGEAEMILHRAAIDRCFAKRTVPEIIAALKEEKSAWAEETLAQLAQKSPTSLMVTLRQMQAGAMIDFDKAMILEYRLSQRFMRGHDFYEGVRALLVDKDHAPRWQPASLEEIDPSEVDAYFRPLDGGDLTLIEL
ncbi:enoyl-CoA hydratase/isomerase family protein [Telmatospirillum sp. J64-1]|uniref:enoyl-CoA hydratase/isomerase family protein n=1 Tax=Telmatospirillum sp. J64-1 TaxID=2502183 RepID=UPI00115D7F1D|nr:enoyl-CoA hydratase/isomerase family protein [Telmatospirillum sp. J64-1]